MLALRELAQESSYDFSDGAADTAIDFVKDQRRVWIDRTGNHRQRQTNASQFAAGHDFCKWTQRRAWMRGDAELNLFQPVRIAFGQRNQRRFKHPPGIASVCMLWVTAALNVRAACARALDKRWATALYRSFACVHAVCNASVSTAASSTARRARRAACSADSVPGGMRSLRAHI